MAVWYAVGVGVAQPGVPQAGEGSEWVSICFKSNRTTPLPESVGGILSLAKLKTRIKSLDYKNR